MFARLGGGIFTKGADVGADIVGKIEAGIPEDDPRNPAVIADNVGDNVGDCAGMAADLFETYAVTAVAVMLLGVLTFTEIRRWRCIRSCLAASRSSAPSSAPTRCGPSGKVERALYQGLIVSGGLAALAFIPLTYWLMQASPGHARHRGGRPAVVVVSAAPSWWHFYLCALIGLGITACLFVITDYYTSTRFAPVRSTARASITGHATNIIQGLAQGYQATALPAIVIALGIFGAWKLGHGIYGIAVAVMAQLSLTGLIVALDAFGPITDNAGGIAEMADLPEEVRNVTDPLDAVGNTTKAVTKGYAIGSAALAALVLFNAFEQQLGRPGARDPFAIGNPPVLIGLLIGGLMVYLFAALSMESVGRAGWAVVEEVRRQFKEKPGIMDGSEQPDYGRACDRDRAGPAGDDPAGADPDRVPGDRRRDLDVQALGGLLIGVIVVGLFMAISMTAGGGAWDNAKKLIEDGEYGGKGSEAHAAAVTGDTVGDPFKDTTGPAINPMIKVANIVALLIIPLIT